MIVVVSGAVLTASSQRLDCVVEWEGTEVVNERPHKLMENWKTKGRPRMNTYVRSEGGIKANNLFDLKQVIKDNNCFK